MGAIYGLQPYRLKEETNPDERPPVIGHGARTRGHRDERGVGAKAVARGGATPWEKRGSARLAGRIVRSGGQRMQVLRPGGCGTWTPGACGGCGRASSATRRSRRAGAGWQWVRPLSNLLRAHEDVGLRRALSTSFAGRAVRRIGGTTIGGGLGRGLGYIGQGARALARTAPARLLGRGLAGGFGYARRGAQWLAQSRAGRWIANSRLGRTASRIYGENLDMARLLFAQSERAHHTYVGGRLRAELAEAQRGGALANAAAAQPVLQTRLGQNFPEVNLADLHARPNPTTGNLEFVRPGTRGSAAVAPGGQRLQPFLDTMRQNEAATINNMITGNPGITDAALAQQLNARPNAPAQWTEAEVWAFRQQANTGAVLKTPHHTISVMDAPHLAYDPRYIQLGNAPLVTTRGHTAAAGTSPYTVFGTSSARRPPGGIGPQLDVPFVRTTNAAEDFPRGTSTVMGRPLTPPPSGAWDPAYFRSEEFFEQLRLQGNTGVWINPHDSSQRLLFDSHFVAGHRWQTGESGARALFGPTVDFAGRFKGAVPQTLLDRSLKTYGRSQAHYSDDWRERGQQSADWMLRRWFGVDIPGAPGEAGGPAGALAATGPGGENETSDAGFPGMPPGSGPMDLGEEQEEAGLPFSMPMGMGSSAAALTAMPRFLMGAGMSGEGGVPGGGPDGPEAPPTDVLYSPQSVISIREQRTMIAEAIGVVNKYIRETREAEQHNRVAEEAAGSLKDKNAEQREFAQAEQNTVAGEQDKLTQAGDAQVNMAAENERASGEAERGKGEGEVAGRRRKCQR